MLTGVTLATAARFEDAFAPLLASFGHLYWLFDLQSGPFSITDKPDFERLDQELDAFFVDLPESWRTSATLWRPGILARFAPLLIHDEQGLFVGIRGDEHEALAVASVVASSTRRELVSDLPANVALLAWFGFSSWEAYSPRADLRAQLLALPHASPLAPADSRLFGSA